MLRQIQKIKEADAEPLFPLIQEAFLDFFAACYAARNENKVQAVKKILLQSGKSPLIGQKGVCGSPGQSALFNGFLGHYLDLDDTSSSVRGHVSAVILPTLLALASERPVSGRRFLAAYGIGEEILARLGKTIGKTHYEKGFHNTATLGVLAGALAGSWMWQLEPGQMASALGMAATQSSGMRANFGTDTKPLQVGMAAEKAVEAVELAAAGMEANEQILDGLLGYFSLYGEGSEKAFPVLCREWEHPWDLEENGFWFKKYPFCSAALHTLDAAVFLRKRYGFQPADIHQVELIFPPGGDAALIQRKPQTGEEGRFSAEYVAALGLCEDTVRIEQFSPDAIPETCRKFMERITRKYDAQILPLPEAEPKGRFTIVRVVFSSGKVCEKRVDIPKGSPGRPLSLEEHREKLEQYCGMDQAKKLFDAIALLPKEQSLSTLFACI